MNTFLLIFAVAIILSLVFGAGFVLNRPKKLNKQHFIEKWQNIQQLCGGKETWPLAIINADKLLDEALKKRHYKGKTMGERLVSAQHSITDNDAVWHGHKLRNRLVHEEVPNLRERDVKNALLGLRQALKDLGAL